MLSLCCSQSLSRRCVAAAKPLRHSLALPTRPRGRIAGDVQFKGTCNHNCVGSACVLHSVRPSGGSRGFHPVPVAEERFEPTESTVAESAAVESRPSGGSRGLTGSSHDDRKDSESTEHEVKEKTGERGWEKWWAAGGKSVEKLKQLGMPAMASYGFVSQAMYMPMLTMAWIAFVRKYAVAPIAQGQWAPFMVFFAGLFAFGNVVRPLRVMVALALTPAFEKLLEKLAELTGLGRRGAFGIYLLAVGTVSLAGMIGTLSLTVGFPYPRPVLA